MLWVRKIIFLSSLIWSALLIAAPQQGDYIPLDVYKVENQINTKVRNALDVLLSEKEYIVDIQIDTVITGPAKKEKKKTFNLSDKAQTKNDYVLFHKLGIESPISTDDEIETEKVPSREELSSIKISIFLDELLEKEKVDMAKSMLGKLTYNFSVTPELNFSLIPFKLKKKDDEVVAEKEMTLLDKIQLASKFSTSIGFLIATLMISVVLFVLLKKFSTMQKAQSDAIIQSQEKIADASNTAAVDTGGFSDSDANELANVSQVGGEASSGSDKDQEGNYKLSVERFKKYFFENKVEGSVLIKKWLNLKTDGASEALMLLAQELDPETLLETFNYISLDDRKEWKGIIVSSTGNEDFTIASHFIDGQILEDIIVPTDLINEKTKALLYGLSPEKCAMLLSENKEFGALLMNSLSSGFIVKMLPYLPPEMMSELTYESVVIKTDKLKEQNDSLQEKLLSYQVVNNDSPFTSKILEILPHVDIDNEEYFFKAFGQSGNQEKMLELLKVYVPASAIIYFPDNALKAIMSRMPQSLLVSYFTICDESKRSKLIEIVAPAGGKKREILDLELENMMSNEIQLAKLKREAGEISTNFVKNARKVIQSNPQLLEEITPILEKICSQYTSSNSGAAAA